MPLMFNIIYYTLLYNERQIFSTHKSKIKKNDDSTIRHQLFNPVTVILYYI